MVKGVHYVINAASLAEARTKPHHVDNYSAVVEFINENFPAQQSVLENSFDLERDIFSKIESVRKHRDWEKLVPDHVNLNVAEVQLRELIQKAVEVQRSLKYKSSAPVLTESILLGQSAYGKKVDSKPFGAPITHKVQVLGNSEHAKSLCQDCNGWMVDLGDKVFLCKDHFLHGDSDKGFVLVRGTSKLQKARSLKHRGQIAASKASQFSKQVSGTQQQVSLNANSQNSGLMKQVDSNQSSFGYIPGVYRPNSYWGSSTQNSIERDSTQQSGLKRHRSISSHNKSSQFQQSHHMIGFSNRVHKDLHDTSAGSKRVYPDCESVIKAYALQTLLKMRILSERGSCKSKSSGEVWSCMGVGCGFTWNPVCVEKCIGRVGAGMGTAPLKFQQSMENGPPAHFAGGVPMELSPAVQTLCISHTQ